MEALPARAHPQAQRDGQCRRLLRQRRRRKNADPPWRQGLANVRKQDCSRWKLEGADGCAGNAALADALQAVQTGLDWLASGDSLTAHGRR